MASTKISALPGATTLTGTETIPLVQGGTTKKVTSDQFLIKDASGNVGVGTASPSAKLEVVGGFRQKAVAGNANGFNITIDSGTDAVTLSNYYNAPLIFGQNNSEIARFSAGNLGLGVTPSAWNASYKALQVGKVGAFWSHGASTDVYLSANYFFDTADKRIADGYATYYKQLNGAHTWATAASSTAGSTISFTQAMTLDASGNLGIGTAIPTSRLHVNSGASTTSAMIESTGTTVWTQLKNSGASAFVGADSTGAFQIQTPGSSYSTKLTVDASGNLLVGTTSTGINDANCFTHNVPAGWFGISHVLGTASGTEYINFGLGGVVKGSITQNGTTGVNYNTSSDARLKENIAAADNGSALIDGLQVRKFDWKADGSHQRFGFVAQELDAVYPEAVSKPADPDEMMGVDYSKLVPLLVQEIQSLRARVAALETV